MALDINQTKGGDSWESLFLGAPTSDERRKKRSQSYGRRDVLLCCSRFLSYAIVSCSNTRENIRNHRTWTVVIPMLFFLSPSE